MKSPKLSICIATYNRAAFIGETLASIIPQLTRDVELVIVDGASTDKTGEVVERHIRGIRNARYVRLPEKGGVDLDFCKAVTMAGGDYVWLFTDDDMIEPGAVARALQEINDGFTLVIANARVFNSDFSEVLAPGMLDVDSDVELKGSEMDRLFELIVPYVSFIGGVIVSRSFWTQRDTTPYVGTEFVHVGVLFQSIIPGKVKIVHQPLVGIRYGNAQWSQRASLIWLWKWPALLSSFQAVSEVVRRRKTNLASWGEMKKMVIYRALRSYTLDTYRKVIRLSPSPLWRRIGAFAVAVMPAAMLRILVSWYLRTFRMHTREARMTLLDLSKV